MLSTRWAFNAKGVGLPTLISRRFCASTTPFACLTMAPPDSILGISADFAKEKNPAKVNLCVGVYRDDKNQSYILNSVRQAMIRVATEDKSIEYAPIGGLPSYIASMQDLAFGEDMMKTSRPHVASVQSLSGTGALSLISQLLIGLCGTKEVHVPTPTYPNHENIFGQMGCQLAYYPYYNAAMHSLDLEGMLGYFGGLAPGSVVMLHACAHNPTGCDPSPAEWEKIVDVMARRGIIPIVDMAYQGFASGNAEQDATVLRLLHAAKAPCYVVCQSLAKNFGLYGQRTGCLHIVCGNPKEKDIVESQLRSLARASYSNPPIFGARVADTVLRDPTLKALWKAELQGMSSRLTDIRRALVVELSKCGSQRDWQHLTRGIGMMSLTGLTKDQVVRLRDQYAIYMTQNGRLAFSGLNSSNVEYVARAIHEVTK